MVDIIPNIWDMDFLDDIPDFDDNFEQYMANPSLISVENFPNDFEIESSVSSEESYALPVPPSLISHDIPINRREWLVKKRTEDRARPPLLFEFLLLLLEKPHYESYASYKNKAEGIFEILEPEKVADLWEHVKNRQSNRRMDYEKFARAIRWYYQKDIMKKTNSRYTFQFTPATLQRVLIDENNNTSYPLYNRN